MSEDCKRTQPTSRPRRAARPLRVPCLEVLSGDQLGLMIQIGAECVVGRSDACHLVLQDSSISRRHARFFTAEGQVQVEDLGSTNGIALGEESIEGVRTLSEGDILSLGDVEVRLGYFSDSQLALAADNFAGSQNSEIFTAMVSKDQFWGWLQMELTQAQDGDLNMTLVDVSDVPHSQGPLPGKTALVLSAVPLRRALAMAERLEARPISAQPLDIRVSLRRGNSAATAQWSFVPVKEQFASSEVARLHNLPARVAHELNTPLGAVSMALEMAVESLDAPDRTERLLGRALDSVEQMRSAIRNLAQTHEWGD